MKARRLRSFTEEFIGAQTKIGPDAKTRLRAATLKSYVFQNYSHPPPCKINLDLMAYRCLGFGPFHISTFWSSGLLVYVTPFDTLRVAKSLLSLTHIKLDLSLSYVCDLHSYFLICFLTTICHNSLLFRNWQAKDIKISVEIYLNFTGPLGPTLPHQRPYLKTVSCPGCAVVVSTLKSMCQV